MGKSPLKNRRVEWSKLLTLLVLLPYLFVIALVSILSLRLMAGGYDASCASVIQALLAFVAAPLAVAYGFYFWKAKAENMVKCAKELKESGVADEVAQEIVNE